MPLTTLIIDNSNFSHRAFWATYRGPDAPILSWDGFPTNAIATWAKMIPGVIARCKPDEVVFVLDGAPSRRLAIYPEYKGQRKEKPEPLKQQLPVIADIVRKSGFSFLEREGEEADDLIVALAQSRAALGAKVFIASADKDFAQVVDSDVHQIIPLAENAWQDFGPAEVAEKFGVPPCGMAAYLALIGDEADNTPGIEGIGPGRALKILKEKPDMTRDEIVAAVVAVKKKMPVAEVERLVDLNLLLIRPMVVDDPTPMKAADASGAVEICRKHNCRRAAEFFASNAHPTSTDDGRAQKTRAPTEQQCVLF
jgi:5'-3' exonuclease